MHHFDLDVDFAGRARVAAHLALFLVVLFGVDLRLGLGQQHVGHHEVVDLGARRVRAQYQLVRDQVAVLFGLGVGEPLHSQARPLEGVGHDQVVEKRSILLPNLVLLHVQLVHLLSVYILAQPSSRKRGRVPDVRHLPPRPAARPRLYISGLLSTPSYSSHSISAAHQLHRVEKVFAGGIFLANVLNWARS